MSYFLTTPRLGFRAWTEDDSQLALDLWEDLEVTRLIGGPFSQEQILHRLSREVATRDGGVSPLTQSVSGGADGDKAMSTSNTR